MRAREVFFLFFSSLLWSLRRRFVLYSSSASRDHRGIENCGGGQRWRGFVGRGVNEFCLCFFTFGLRQLTRASVKDDVSPRRQRCLR